jgi:adenylate cyclase
MIEFEAHEHLLRDLGSANGTFLNGKRVNAAALRHGDVIRVGGTSFEFDTMGGSRTERHQKVRIGDEAPPSVLATVQLSIDSPPFDTVSAASGVEELSRALQKYKLVYQANEVITRLSKPAEFFAVILEQLFETLHADNGLVVLGPDPDHVTVAATRTKIPRALVLSRTVLRRVYEQKEALLIEDALLDHRLYGADSVIGTPVRSLLCVPLAFGDKVTGIVQIESHHRNNAFNQADLEVVAAIGRRAAIALENVRQLEEQRTAALRVELSRYLASDRVEERIERSEWLDPASSKKVTVLACRISDRALLLTPNGADQTLLAVNSCLDRIASVVFRHRGTLGRMSEAGAVAFWGAPDAQPDASQRAVLCGLELVAPEAQQELRAGSPRMPLPAFAIGLHRGEAIVGYVGSALRKDYAAIGPTVERAIALSKEAEVGSLLVSEELHQELGPALAGHWRGADATPRRGTASGPATARAFVAQGIRTTEEEVEVTLSIENE